jgi:hypothetical protein
MVDFNNETTIGRPAVDIVRVLILQARNDTLTAIEDYRLKKHVRSEASLSVIESRMFKWYLEMEAMLSRKMKGGKEFLELKRRFLNLEKTEEEVFVLVSYLNKVCDDIKLTVIDTQQVYDTTLWEEGNKAHGFY